MWKKMWNFRSSLDGCWTRVVLLLQWGCLKYFALARSPWPYLLYYHTQWRKPSDIRVCGFARIKLNASCNIQWVLKHIDLNYLYIKWIWILFTPLLLRYFAHPCTIVSIGWYILSLLLSVCNDSYFLGNFMLLYSPGWASTF